MKQSRTTLKELTAAYRAVLRHGILCNAIALGLIAAAPAMADPITETVNNRTEQVHLFNTENGSYEITNSHYTGNENVDKNGIVAWLTSPGAGIAGSSLNVSDSEFVNNVSYIGGALGTGTRGGMLTVSGSTFEGNHAIADGGAIGNYAGLNISGSTFTNNTAQYAKNGETGEYNVAVEDGIPVGGGAIALGALSSTSIGSIIDTTFTGNKSGRNGGAIGTRLGSDADNHAAKLDIEATFTGNQAAQSGGAIYNTFYADNGLDKGDGVTVTGTFTENQAKNGGAIYNDGAVDKASNAGGVMTINDSTFTGNVALVPNTDATYKREGVGGAIASSGTLTINGSTFENNTALTSGTGWGLGGAASTVTVDGLATSMTINNSTFTGNQADVGGAVYGMLKKSGEPGLSSITINNSTFDGNKAASGSAIANFDIMSVTDTTFKNSLTLERAENDGGTAFLGSESVTSFTGGSFEDNTSLVSGGAIATRNMNDGNNVGAKLDINGTSFARNTATTNGGAIDNHFYNDAAGDGYVSVNDATFTENSATSGGAIYNHKNATQTGNMNITDTTFTGNIASANGGAIYNEGALTLNNTTFGGESAALGNTAMQGGAIYNTGTMTFDGGVSFLNNNSEAVTNSKAAAIFNTAGSTMTFNDDATFTGNKADKGGAIVNNGTMTFDADSTYLFSGNSSKSSVGGGAIKNGSTGVITITAKTTFDNNTAGTSSKQDGGAISNNGTLTVNGTSADKVVFSNNTALRGGAIFNDATAGNATISNALFDSNVSAGSVLSAAGGAIANRNTATIIDSNFINNTTVSGDGGAIYNNATTGSHGTNAVLTIKAVGDNVLFDNNKAKYGTANEFANDISNKGGDGTHTATLNLNAANGKSITLNGGITGASSKKAFSIVNINNDGTSTGTVDIAGDLKYQTVAVDAGELHLSKSGASNDLTDSTITVADGAYINTINDYIDDYTSFITLQNGANIKGDIDFTAGTADTYASTGAASVNYKVGNLIGAVGNGSKNIQVASDGTTVNDEGFAWFNSADGLSLTSSGAADGMITVTGLAGGIAQAADVSATVSEVDYNLTANETLSTAKTLQNSFTLNGDGTDVADKGLTLAANLGTTAGADVEINDLKLAGTGSLNNASGATMRINNSLVDVDLNNEGTLMSDPTTYSGTVTNSGFASFDADTFTGTAVLANSGNVSLANGVTFETGATITGAGTTSLAGGVTHFNDTANTNTINVASGANFDGTIIGGAINTQNGMMDVIAGAINGMEVALDVNTTAGTSDTFASVTGSTIKSLNVSGAYGTTNTVDVTVDSGLTLDSNATINGGYYTHVAQSGTTLTFSDMLINESGLYSRLGSWTGGNYIKANVDLDNAADANHLTVGQALSALDTQAKLNADNIATLNGAEGDTGSVRNIAKGYADTAVTTANSYTDTTVTALANGAVATNTAAIATLNGAEGDTGSVRNIAKGYADTAETNAKAYTDALASGAVATNTAAIATLNGAEGDTGSVRNIAKSYADTAASSATTTANSYTDTAVAALASGAVATNTAAIATLNGAEGDAGSVRNIAKSYADTAVTTANAYTDTAVAALASGAVATNTAAIATLNGAEGDAGSVRNIAKSYADAAASSAASTANSYTDTAVAALASGAVATNTAAIAVLNGAESDANSVRNIAKGYADTATANANTYTDGKIGTIAADGTHIVAANTVSSNLVALDVAVAAVETSIGTTTDGAHVLAANSIGTNLNALDTALATAEGQIATLNGAENVTGSVRNIAKAYVDAGLAGANAYTDERIEKLDENLSAGVASAVALSSVAVSDVRRGEVSVGAGYGYFNGQSAGAFGAAMGISNRWSVNAGAGVSGYDVSFRAGTNYKFKLF